MRTPESPVFWKVFGAMTRVNVVLYRATGGKVGGRMGKAPILLLHHVGRKSGQARLTPLIYVPDGERVAVIASKGGMPKNPAWFHNLMAAGEAEIEIGRERRRVRPRVAEGDERVDLWRRAVALYGSYESYQRQTDRQIPVVVLEPR